MPTKKRIAIQKKPEGAYHHGQLKVALKEAALRLVRDKGPREFSLNEASRLAGVSVGAPYRHFQDKDALLAELACDGMDLMVRELREAAGTITGIREKMLTVGLTYLKFSRAHADYFAVIFQAGLDKANHPELERKAGEAFDVILELAQQYERTRDLARQRAVLCWALVHGLATLSIEGALSTGMQEKADFGHIQPLLEQFLRQPYR